MTTWTTIAATKAALIDRLQASPTLAGIVLDGVPTKANEIVGERGDGLSVWFDNAESEVTIEPRALGSNGAKITETYTLTVRVQCVGMDSDVDVREAEARCDELVSAVMNVIYGDSYVVEIPLTGWSVRARFTGMAWNSGPELNHDGYSAQAMVDMRIEATRC